MSIVSGSHTVELLSYCGDVALQCESLSNAVQWVFVQYPVFTKYSFTIALHSSSRADSDATDMCAHSVFIVQAFFYRNGPLPSDRKAKISAGKMRTVSGKRSNYRFLHI